MKRPASIVILTGAGISAESGVDTFRDAGGIWSKVDYRDVATPQGFARNPSLVHDFYNQRRRGMAGVAPNAAHVALARLDHAFGGELLLVTQNIEVKRTIRVVRPTFIRGESPAGLANSAYRLLV